MYDPSEALLQLGLYDYVWGEPGLLNTYNSNVQAEKARQENLAYQNMWKQIEKDKLDAEKQKTERAELAEAEAKMAELNKSLVNAKPQEAEVIKKQQAALLTRFPKLQDSYETALKAKVAEDNYQKRLINYKSMIPRIFNNDNEIDAEIQRVADSGLRESDKNDIITELRGKKSTKQMAAEARQSSIASHTGKKTTETLEEQDLTNKAQTAISSNTSPASLDEKVLNAIRSLGYSWNGTNWFKR